MNQITTIIKNRYKLNKSQLKVYLMLLHTTEDKPISMKKLVEIVGKDRTTIQRTLWLLQEKGLVNKIQLNGMLTRCNKNKGFSYVYYINETHYRAMREFVSKQIEMLNNQWSEL